MPIEIFLYHRKAHTISNKLISKVFANMEEKKSYYSYKYVFKFWLFQVPFPLNVLQLAHNSMMAGHFGQERMMEAIRRWVDWPGRATDVRELCKSCPTHQKAKPAAVDKALYTPYPFLKTLSSV